MAISSTPETLARQAEAFAENGKLADAIACLKQAVKREPRFFQGWLKLSKYLFAAGYFSEAVQVGQAAERFDPLQAEFQSIQNAMQRKDFNQAEQTAKQMLAKQPGHPRAVFTLAQVSGLKNYPEGQVAALQHGLAHSPANLVLRKLQVSAMEAAGDYAGAIEAARTLVRTEESFPALWTLVSVLLRYGRNEELLEVCARARTVCAGDARKLSEVDLVRGQILRVMGRREDSVAAYRACLDQNPANAGAWWALADMKTYAFSRADQLAIEAVLDQPDITSQTKSLAWFALAKVKESEADWDAAMPLYQSANAANEAARFDPEQFSRAVAARVEALDAAALSVQADQPAKGPRPIFILGLPRSGSTLLEQILASHSEIEGTIEQPVMPSIARKAHVKCALEYGGDFLHKIGDLTAPELAELGQAYVDDGALFRSEGASHFTDKLPFNFLHVGLIQKILPHAVIIDTRRNPMDCGLSLFKQHFTAGVDFSYDQSHIGAYYNQYLTLMDHWDRVLPGRVWRVEYEALVHAPEPHIRKLLDHIGLAFEPGCLSFHKTDRAVRTASSEQVRQPINTRGIGAWRNVEAHLQPLKDSLGPATLSRFQSVLQN